MIVIFLCGLHVSCETILVQESVGTSYQLSTWAILGNIGLRIWQYGTRANIPQYGLSKQG